jgi:biotin carboxyl carrier protein
MTQHEAETRRPVIARLLPIIHGLGLLLVFLIGVYAHLGGKLFLALFLLILVSIPVVVAVRLWGLLRKELVWSFLRRPLQPENRRYLRQALLQWIFWLSLVFALRLSFPDVIFGKEILLAFHVSLWGIAVALMILALVPNKTVRPATMIFFAVASLCLWIELGRTFWPAPPDETVVLDPPFQGEWYVFHGGRSPLVNYHVQHKDQRNALDINQPASVDPEGRTSPTLATHPSFGQPLYAPADGRVVKAVNDRPDLEIGQADRKQILGNHVVLQIGEERYVLMAHLMQNSVLVKPGDEVRSGQVIARCGNSGNTTEPHLHLQVQSHPDFRAEGLRTYPICMRGARRRNGRVERLECADLRRNDVIIGEAGGVKEARADEASR